jgi:hypothetical protein
MAEGIFWKNWFWLSKHRERVTDKQIPHGVQGGGIFSEFPNGEGIIILAGMLIGDDPD